MTHFGVKAIGLAAVLLGGCAHQPRSSAPVLAAATASTVPVAATPPGWESMVSADDRARLATAPQRWALARSALDRRYAKRLAGEGPLLEPAAALDLPALPPGPYHCRLVRLARAGVTSFKPDFCYVEGDTKGLSFTKLGGSRLFGGWLFPDTAQRQVLLATVRARPNGPMPRYGADAASDIVATVERVSPFRWRMVLGKAAGRGGLLDVYELVPVTPEVPGATPALPAPIASR